MFMGEKDEAEDSSGGGDMMKINILILNGHMQLERMFETRHFTAFFGKKKKNHLSLFCLGSHKPAALNRGGLHDYNNVYKCGNPYTVSSRPYKMHRAGKISHGKLT